MPLTIRRQGMDMARNERSSTRGKQSNKDDSVATHAAERARPEAISQDNTPGNEIQGATPAALARTIEEGHQAATEIGSSVDGLSRDLMANAGRLFERSSRTMQEMWQARTVEDVMRLQFDMAHAVVEAQIKYVEAIGRAAGDMKRLGGNPLQRAFDHMNPGQRDIVGDA